MYTIFVTYMAILYVLVVSSPIIYFVGWLTHANYYYKIHKKFEPGFLFLHCVISVMIIIFSATGFLVGGINNELYILSQVLLFGYTSILFFVVILYTCYEKIIKLRNYFADKRGVEHD